METTLTALPESRVKVEATVPPEDLDAGMKRAATTLAAEMKMPGFRKGKVPPELVVQRFGRELVLEQALRDRLGEWYEQALLQAEVNPIGDPQLDVPDPPAEGEPLVITIEVAIRPTATLGDYKQLEVPKAEVDPPAEAVDAELDRIRDGLSSLAPVERAAAEGDYLMIDYRGEVDGEGFEGGEAKDYMLELGSDGLLPEFNESLAGAEAGDQRGFEVKFPDEHPDEDLAGATAKFAVTVKEVREKNVPALDDDFAADNTEFETVAELRADIERKLSEALERRSEEQFREAALNAAADAATVELPEEIVSARAKEMWERVEHTLSHQGMDPAMYLQFQGTTREEAIENGREEAARGLRREAALAAIVEAEAIEVSEDELLEALTPPAGEKGKPEKLLKRVRKEGREKLLVEDVAMRKAADLVVAAASPIPFVPDEHDHAGHDHDHDHEDSSEEE